MSNKNIEMVISTILVVLVSKYPNILVASVFPRFPQSSHQTVIAMLVVNVTKSCHLLVHSQDVDKVTTELIICYSYYGVTSVSRFRGFD